VLTCCGRDVVGRRRGFGNAPLAVAAALVGRVAWGRTELGIRWSGVVLWLLAIAAMALLLWFGYQFAHGFVF